MQSTYSVDVLTIVLSRSGKKKPSCRQQAVYTSISNMVSWETSLTEFYLGPLFASIEKEWFQAFISWLPPESCSSFTWKETKVFCFFSRFFNARKSLGSKRNQAALFTWSMKAMYHESFGHDYQNSQKYLQLALIAT